MKAIYNTIEKTFDESSLKAIKRKIETLNQILIQGSDVGLDDLVCKDTINNLTSKYEKLINNYWNVFLLLTLNNLILFK